MKIKLIFQDKFWRFVWALYWLYKNWLLVEDLYQRAAELVKEAEEAADTSEEKRQYFNERFQRDIERISKSLRSTSFWTNVLREIALGAIKYVNK